MLHRDVLEQDVGQVEVQGVQVEDEDVDGSLEETSFVLVILWVGEAVV